MDHFTELILVIERMKQLADGDMDLADGLVIDSQFSNAALLTPCLGVALHVCEHDVEHINHIVSGATSQRLTKCHQDCLASELFVVDELAHPRILAVTSERCDLTGREP
jgi:hypothetical protein